MLIFIIFFDLLLSRTLYQKINNAMKSKFTIHRIAIFLMLSAFYLTMGTPDAAAQDYKLSNQGELMVTGTSTLHDWEITADQISGTLVLDTSGELPVIKDLTFSVLAESLKSGKESMDNNTYKALKTDDHKNITFRMRRFGKIEPMVAPEDRYRASVAGDLTVAGQTRQIELNFTLTLENGQARIKGTEPMKMTDYKIDPPRALLGTIKTGDAIEIEFNTHWTSY